VAAPPAGTPDTLSPQLDAVAAASVSATTVTLTWSTDEPASTLVEFGSSTSYGQSSPQNDTPVTSHSVVLSGLTANTTYHYRVRSRDAAGNESVSTDFTFRTAGLGSATITWDGSEANADATGTALADLAGYRIYASTTPNQYPATPAREIAVTTAGGVQTSTVTGLVAGTYYFVVTAFDTSGNESMRSNEISRVVTTP
jgi:fibronectin type 3 domain-containing protein